MLALLADSSDVYIFTRIPHLHVTYIAWLQLYDAFNLVSVLQLNVIHVPSRHANVGYLLGPCPDTSFLFSLPLIAFSRRDALLCTGISSLEEMTDTKSVTLGSCATVDFAQERAQVADTHDTNKRC